MRPGGGTTGFLAAGFILAFVGLGAFGLDCAGEEPTQSVPLEQTWKTGDVYTVILSSVSDGKSLVDLGEFGQLGPYETRVELLYRAVVRIGNVGQEGPESFALKIITFRTTTKSDVPIYGGEHVKPDPLEGGELEFEKRGETWWRRWRKYDEFLEEYSDYTEWEQTPDNFFPIAIARGVTGLLPSSAVKVGDSWIANLRLWGWEMTVDVNLVGFEKYDGILCAKLLLNTRETSQWMRDSGMEALFGNAHVALDNGQVLAVDLSGNIRKSEEGPGRITKTKGKFTISYKVIRGESHEDAPDD